MIRAAMAIALIASTSCSSGSREPEVGATALKCPATDPGTATYPWGATGDSLCAKYLHDRAALEKLLKLDDDVVSAKDKAAYKLGFQCHYSSSTPADGPKSCVASSP